MKQAEKPSESAEKSGGNGSGNGRNRADLIERRGYYYDLYNRNIL